VVVFVWVDDDGFGVDVVVDEWLDFFVV